ncbi:R3H domain-containing protein 2 [Psilocybe cubensis]|uniref:R3H domain-containing protein 2 n=1 Tax=Psilocybe cubensis TaxID=181762 RepID=A0ACB8GUM1_PSICU|nr:R3H domain-containing protein 2 [Psilocybe cubensis]KAH9479440.1 R3H domain-containing protein 2 [Psilocybe cubensis]
MALAPALSHPSHHHNPPPHQPQSQSLSLPAPLPSDHLQISPSSPPPSTSPTLQHSSLIQHRTSPSPTRSFMDAPTQLDHPVQYPSISPLPPPNIVPILDPESAPASVPTTPDVDPQILEALRSKDRIYVLKLGETFEALITERRTRVELSPATSYQRLLVHRCSAYYKLAPESDPITKGIFVVSTADSRIPDRRISELVPAEATTQPSFKIMRRSVQDRRSKPHSQAGSVAGEDVDLSDVEPSESGSNATSSSHHNNKKRMTIEEREAAYNEARSRIFMDFEEKEKNKDKDMSASSSSLSLTGSASTSAGGRSSIGDTDDAASSPATESEWSAPSASHSRDRKDVRRGGPANGSASSNRSLRNGGGGSFYNNGSGGSSRNSRAPSPSLHFPSIHDTSPGHVYDPSQPHHNPNMAYYPAQYYPYSPPGQAPAPPFMPPYYYPHHYNPYQPPPITQHSSSDPTTPSGPEPYSPPHQVNYAPHYNWGPHPSQQPLQSPPPLNLPPPQPQQNQIHPMGPPPPMQPQSPQYQPFGHPSHPFTYPINGYYPQAHMPPPPPGQQMPPPPPHMNVPPQQQHQHQNPPQPQQQPVYNDVPRAVNGNSHIGAAHASANGHFNPHNGNGPRNGLGNGVIAPNSHNNNNNNRSNVRNGVGGGAPGLMNVNNANGNGNGVNGGGKHRVQMPPAGRSAWSYGPGVGNGGYVPHNSNNGEAVGPRFHAHRQPSGNSSSGGRSSNCDDVSSTSSSTTSSSSRRTYTSTTSSQHHPLPARPDWAVGLKAQPTLAAMGGGRHQEHSLNNSRNISPISQPRSNGHNSPMPNGNNQQQNGASLSLQATDFPPLSGAAPEKRAPVVTGAWGQSRPILTPAAANGNANGSAPIAATANVNGTANPGSAQHSPVIKQEDVIKPGEIINPKLARRPPAVVNGQGPAHQRSQSAGKELTSAKGDSVAASASALVGQVASMSLGGGEAGGIDVSPSAPSVFANSSTNNANTATTTSASAPSVVAPAPSV